MNTNLPLPAHPSESLTPMMRQYFEIKQQHQDAILFFRLGDFYEMFFEDAQKASAILEIALTSRNKNEAESVPLCGIPYHAATAYIRKLLDHGLKVAICEQVEDPKMAKGIVKREVVQVLTPGLYVETEELASSLPNYLAAIAIDPEQANYYRAAFCDFSTGEIGICDFDSLENLTAQLQQLQVREILGPKPVLEALQKIPNDYFAKVSVTDCSDSSLSNNSPAWDTAAFSQDFLNSRKEFSQTKFAPLLEKLVRYIAKTQKTNFHHFGAIQDWGREEYLRIDAKTFRHLEVAQNSREGNRQHTLYSTLDACSTRMGSRLLLTWLHRPLLRAAAIAARLDAVEELTQKPESLFEIQHELRSVRDIERMLGRFALKSVQARDLQNLAQSIEAAKHLLQSLEKKLETPLLRSKLQNFPKLEDLAKLLLASLLAELPLSIRDGGMIADGHHAELDELREISRSGKGFIAALEAKERERTQISSLKIRYNKVFGYYIEITHSHRDKVPADYLRKQTLANAERFITPELKDYESKVLNADERIKNLEYELFCQLREQCLQNLEDLRNLAKNLAHLDVWASLAKIARERRWTRPQFVAEKILDLRDSRHPVLEKILGHEFIPNDIQTDQNHWLLLITGPNMAGKSTVMRQSALIILMAQLGSFVPAASATIGLCDQILARIGAGDDLSQGHSTFMVEMLETSQIIASASEKSFIVFDEIGRGTSTYDGMALAWSIAEHVASQIRCRTLFATHYHELTELGSVCPGVANYQVAVKEWNDQILFLHKLVPGGASRSYGIEVARLAGLPPTLLQRAREVLVQLEQAEDSALQALTPESDQLSLFKAVEHPLIAEIKKLQPEAMTPLQALEFLFNLKKNI